MRDPPGPRRRREGLGGGGGRLGRSAIGCARPSPCSHWLRGRGYRASHHTPSLPRSAGAGVLSQRTLGALLPHSPPQTGIQRRPPNPLHPLGCCPPPDSSHMGVFSPSPPYTPRAVASPYQSILPAPTLKLAPTLHAPQKLGWCHLSVLPRAAAPASCPLPRAGAGPRLPGTSHCSSGSSFGQLRSHSGPLAGTPQSLGWVVAPTLRTRQPQPRVPRVTVRLPHASQDLGSVR